MDEGRGSSAAAAPDGSDVPASGRLGTLTESLRDPGNWPDWWPVAVALILVSAIFGLMTETFLTPANIEAILVSGAMLCVLAVGQAFVVMTAGIDLSIGAMTTFSGILIGFIAVRLGFPVPIALVVAVLISVLAGVINGVIITKGKISEFIVTLGMLSVVTGTGWILSNAQSVAVPDPILRELASGSLGPFRWMFVIAFVVAIIGHIVLFHTRFGTYVLATGGNRDAARRAGINTDLVRIAAFGISGLLAGIAGVMLTARLGASETQVGVSFLLNSVAAVILGGVSLFGGRGTVFGPFAGALVLTALINGMTLMGISVFYQPIVVGAVVVLSAALSRFQEQ